MKRIFALILTIALLLTACGNGGQTAKLSIMSQDVGKGGLSGTLEIFTGYKDLEIELIDGFKALNPNVEIVMSDGLITDDMVAEEIIVASGATLESLRTRMISGDAPDLIWGLDISYKDFLGGEMLRDIYEFIELDESFDTDDYFMNVLEAMEVKGRLPAMPLTVGFRLMRFNLDVLEAVGMTEDDIDVVDYNFLIDTYYKVKESEKLPEFEAIRMGKENNIIEAIPSIYIEVDSKIDLNELTADYQSEEFIDFLEKTISYDGKNDYTRDEHGQYLESDEEPFEDNRFLINMNLDIHPLGIRTAVNEYDNTSDFYPISASNGKVFTSVNTLAIPTNAKNPSLAWEFIKYCIYESESVGSLVLSKEMIAGKGQWNGDRFFGGIPVNKNNFRKYFDKALLLYSDEIKENFFENIEGILERELFVPSASAFMLDLQYKTILDYYDGLMSAEDCAKALQDRIDIYFGELS